MKSAKRFSDDPKCPAFVNHLHIGNIFFLDDSKIGLIDFGHIFSISKDMSKHIAMFYKFMFNRQIKKLSRHILENIIVYNGSNPVLQHENLNKVMCNVENSFKDENVLSGKKPLEIRNILELNNILIDIDGKLKDEFMSIIIALGPLSSVVSILKRDSNDECLKNVFNNYTKKQIPSNLKIYS